MTKMSTMAVEGGSAGIARFYDMVRFSEAYDTCKRVALAKHFKEQFQASEYVFFFLNFENYLTIFYFIGSHFNLTYFNLTYFN